MIVSSSQFVVQPFSQGGWDKNLPVCFSVLDNVSVRSREDKSKSKLQSKFQFNMYNCNIVQLGKDH